MSIIRVTGRVTDSTWVPVPGQTVELQSKVKGNVFEEQLPRFEEPLRYGEPLLAAVEPARIGETIARRSRQEEDRGSDLTPGYVAMASPGGGVLLRTWVAMGPSTTLLTDAQGEFAADFDVSAAEAEVRRELDLGEDEELLYSVHARVRTPPSGEIVASRGTQFLPISRFPYHFEVRFPPTPQPLPLVWAPTLPIRLLWYATAAGTDLSIVESNLRAFNDRLYDCTDGQWRAGRFLIHDNRSELSPTGNGVGHIHRTGTHREHGHPEGRPNSPAHWEVNENSTAGAYLMEFLHSWTGLRDEYQNADGEPIANCPATAQDRTSSNACVMDRTSGTTELCRPENHNPDTEQGRSRGMSCYSWLRKVMHDAGYGEFTVPPGQIPGPATAPRLRFVYLTIRRVKLVGDTGSPEFYAKVRMNWKGFARSKHQSDRAEVTPNWFFGLGLCSDQDVKVPIQIQIWDYDPWNDNDLYDVSPVAGKKSLDITYDTATGQIGGDVTGMRDTQITVRGAGDGNRVELTFEITSR